MAREGRLIRSWYSIPVSSLRRGLVLLVLLLGAVVGWLGYRSWQRGSEEQSAAEIIRKATELVGQLEQRESYAQIRVDHAVIWEQLQEARVAYEAKDYRTAYQAGENSLLRLESILGRADGDDGAIRFLRVQGGVEYRQGENGAWKRARSRDSLNTGDWVKTSADGTAEVIFPDGALYILRPNTMVHLGDAFSGRTRGQAQRPTDVAFGRVELNTSQSPSAVTTPKSTASVQERSEAFVSYDREGNRGRFAAYEGGLQVTSESGEKRELRALQQVEVEGGQLSETQALPARPRLIQPLNEHEVDIDREKRIRLVWQEVPSADRYALRVSRSQLFASNIIEDFNRTKTSATLGIRGEGSFFWQIAAIAADGTGPWSAPGSFRVTSLSGVRGKVDDKTPPELELREIQTYGSLVIVNGKAEPGSTVTINAEPVSLQVDGGFSKTVQMTQPGWGFIDVVATDAWGNPNQQRERVFIDAF